MVQNADLIKRIVAVIIDTLILWVIAIVLAIPLGLSAAAFSMAYPMTMANMWAGAWISFMLLMLVLWILYFTYLEGTRGQTVGKMITSIKVVRENGKKPVIGDAFIRTILRVIDFLPFAYILGFILILGSDKRQRLGDMAVKTIVVNA